jgi:hypothetical protein
MAMTVPAPHERLVPGHPDAASVRTHAPTGRPCPAMLPLNATENGAADALPLMHTVNGRDTLRLRLPLCMGRGPQCMHAAPACPPVCCCCRTCPCVALLLSPRAAVAAPTGPTPPTGAVRMRLCMQVGATVPARGDHLCLGPLPAPGHVTLAT